MHETYSRMNGRAHINVNTTKNTESSPNTEKKHSTKSSTFMIKILKVFNLIKRSMKNPTVNKKPRLMVKDQIFSPKIKNKIKMLILTTFIQYLKEVLAGQLSKKRK